MSEQDKFRNKSGIVRLPPQISSFIRAVNRHDCENMVQSFDDHAIVYEFSTRCHGRNEIQSWCVHVLALKKIMIEVHEVVNHSGDFLITVCADGYFDKGRYPEPNFLDAYIRLANEKIVTLIIIRNNERSAKPIF